MLVLGHRGVINETVSQNSLLTFQQAIETADGFETDAVVSQDGEIFLIHQEQENGTYSLAKHLDGASAERLGTRRLDQLSAAEIRTFRLRDGQPLPTLHEAIELAGLHAGKTLNIELKARDVVGPVLKLVKSSLQKGIIKPEALILSSFNHLALQAVRQEMPHLKTGAIFVTDDEAGEKLYPWIVEDKTAYAALTPAILQSPLLRVIQPDHRKGRGAARRSIQAMVLLAG